MFTLMKTFHIIRHPTFWFKINVLDLKSLHYILSSNFLSQFYAPGAITIATL